MYHKVRSLGGNAVRNIMAHLNIEAYEKYMSNVAYLRNFLEEAGYNGRITEKSIIAYVDRLNKFVLPTQEATPADYILAKILYDDDKRERNEIVNKFYNSVDSFINSISKTPLPEERWNIRENKFLEKLDSRKFVIDFDDYDDNNRQRIVKMMLEKFWTPFMNKITIEQKWIIKYYTEHGEVNYLLYR